MSTEIRSVAQLQGMMDHEVPLVIKLYFPWCGHCQHIQKPFEQLAKKMKRHALFASVNMDKLPQIAQALSVTAGPTFLLFHGGQEAARVNGADLEAVAEWF